MDNNKLFAKDEDQNKLADFREILFTYLVYWKWFVLCAILSVGYTAFDLAQKNDVYMVSTSILMKNDRNSGSASHHVATFQKEKSEHLFLGFLAVCTGLPPCFWCKVSCPVFFVHLNMNQCSLSYVMNVFLPLCLFLNCLNDAF